MAPTEQPIKPEVTSLCLPFLPSTSQRSGTLPRRGSVSEKGLQTGDEGERGRKTGEAHRCPMGNLDSE